ncbi:MAG: beta-ketoacyl synthase N-terminal-like domain-containing protein [Enhygromyxa sp.]
MAVTGVGVVSPLASDAERHFDALLGGRSGVGRCEPDAARLLELLGWARVRELDRRAQVRTRMLRKVLRPAALYAVVAAGEALAQAELEPHGPQLFDGGLFVGSAGVEADSALFFPAIATSLDRQGRFDLALFARRGRRQVDPLVIVKGLPNAGLCGVAIEHGVRGPNLNLSGICAGPHALISAYASVRSGRTRLALAGGYDSRCTVDLVAVHRHAGELSDTVADAGLGARPFDRRRDGFVPGEGAAFCVLEPEHLARRRGVRPLAIIEDARRSCCSAADGAERSRALASLLSALAGPRPDLVFATGAAGRDSDVVEAQAIRAAWSSSPEVTATTGATGFLGAAHGILSFVHACQSLARGQVPPTLGCEQPEPALGVPVIADTHARPCDRAVVLAGHSQHQLAVSLRSAE